MSCQDVNAFVVSFSPNKEDEQNIDDEIGPNVAQYFEKGDSYISGFPTNYDVLCNAAKDAAYFHHPGNKRLRVMVALKLDEYEKLNENFKRNRFLDLFIQKTLSTSRPRCRFLAWDGNHWRVLNERYAKKKVADVFDQCLSERMIQSEHEEATFQGVVVPV